MRVLRAKVTDLKSGVNFLIRLNSIDPSLGFSNEILGIHAAKETVKLPKVKV